MRKIAIIRRNGLGDLLCTLPLIHYLQNKASEITLFVEERNAPLLPYLPPIGKVVVLRSRGNKYFHLLKSALFYRSAHFDLAISAKTSPMKLINFFLYALGGKERIAYVDRAWHSRLINHPLYFDLEESKKKHQALKALQMVAPHLNEVPKELYPKLILPQSSSNQEPKLLLSASTTRSSSRLDERRYAAIVNRLYNECAPFHTHIVAQKGDRYRAEMLQAHLKVPNQLHFPQNFEQFILLMGGCDVYFIGDGGIGHIGAALNKRGVVLFGETNPVEWAPLGGDFDCIYDRLHVNRLSDEVIFQKMREKIYAR